MKEELDLLWQESNTKDVECFFNDWLEGMNNKIKVLKRKAYGYRDIEYFNLKILDLHNARYALVKS